MPDIERRYTRTQAAKWLQDRGYPIAVATLAKYATLAGGPRYEKFGRKPLYTESDLIDWVAAKTGAPVRHSSASNVR